MRLLNPILMGLLSCVISGIVLAVEKIRASRWNSERFAYYQEKKDNSIDQLIIRLSVIRRAFAYVAIGAAIETVFIGISTLVIYLIYKGKFINLLVTVAITFLLIFFSMLINWWAFGIELTRIKELQQESKVRSKKCK